MSGNVNFEGTDEEWDALVEKNKLTQSSMKKQTAVEWLIEQIDNKDMGEIPIWIYVICEDAKAMMNEQIEAAYRAGYTDCSLDRFSDSEKYYTSTYE